MDDNRSKNFKYLSVILLVLLLASLFSNGFRFGDNGIGIDKASEKAVNYLNNNILQNKAAADIVGQEDIGDLYKINISIQGRVFESYITKDGKFLFPQGIRLDSFSDSIGKTKTADNTAAKTDTKENVKEVSADDDPSLGPEDADITVIEFSDFQCPFCGAAMGTNSRLISQFKSRDPTWEAPVPKLKELAEAGKIRFVYRDFPLNSIHPYAEKAAEASECAHEQGKFWEYHDRLFENQDALTLDDLKQYASDLGLDGSRFDSCLESGKYEEEVKKDLADGSAAGVSGTPAFFVNGVLISGAQSFKAFESMIG